MRLVPGRVPAIHPQIHHHHAGRDFLHHKNSRETVLLPRLPVHVVARNQTGTGTRHSRLAEKGNGRSRTGLKFLIESFRPVDQKIADDPSARVSVCHPLVFICATSDGRTRVAAVHICRSGIYFYAESILREDARYRPELDEAVRQNDRQGLLALRPDQSMGTNFLHIYYLKKMAVNGIHFREQNFVKDTAALRPVEGGIDEPLPRVSSHELGHAFGLPHRQNTTNLMASGTTGLWLNEEEIKIARGIAGKMPWTESVAIINQRLKDAPSGKEAAHSKVWRERLAEIAFLLKGRKNE